MIISFVNREEEYKEEEKENERNEKRAPVWNDNNLTTCLIINFLLQCARDRPES